MKVKVTKNVSGTKSISHRITLPKKILQELKIDSTTKLLIEIVDNKIILSKEVE